MNFDLHFWAYQGNLKVMLIQLSRNNAIFDRRRSGFNIYEKAAFSTSSINH